MLQLPDPWESFGIDGIQNMAIPHGMLAPADDEFWATPTFNKENHTPKKWKWNKIPTFFWNLKRQQVKAFWGRQRAMWSQSWEAYSNHRPLVVIDKS